MEYSKDNHLMLCKIRIFISMYTNVLYKCLYIIYIYIYICTDLKGVGVAVVSNEK